MDRRRRRPVDLARPEVTEGVDGRSASVVADAVVGFRRPPVAVTPAMGRHEGHEADTGVSERHVRDLLEAGSASSRLLLVEGQVRLDRDGSEQPGIVIAEYDEVVSRLGTRPDAAQLQAEAAQLNVQLTQLGG